MSLYGAEFLRKAKKLLSGDGLEGPDVQFHPHGYLFLASEMGAEQLIANHKLQTYGYQHVLQCPWHSVCFIIQNDGYRSLGAKIQLLTPKKLKEKFPWIKTDDIALASYGLENEGW